jgi:hypothetical protein
MKSSMVGRLALHHAEKNLNEVLAALDDKDRADDPRARSPAQTGAPFAAP